MLPQYKNSAEPVFHQFVVFSVLGDDDTLTAKYVNCNNCGATHKVVDLCQSEIVIGKEESNSAMKITDFKIMLPSSVYDLLVQYSRELADFEHANFILDEEQWDSTIVLSREDMNGDLVQGKLLRFVSKDKFRMESYSYQEFFESK